MKLPKFTPFFCASLIFVAAAPASACDLCAVYTARNIKDVQGGGVTLGVYEQFTSFNTLQEDGRHIENTLHQSLSSSITQIYGRYDLTNEAAVQLNLPFISRDFKRAEGGMLQSGSESGIGDISLLGIYSPVKVQDGEMFFRLNLRGGLKLPTGDASRIREETEEGGMADMAGMTDEEMAAMDSGRSGPKHAGHDHADEIPSGIHGHDLALGSGSFDYIVGTSALVELGMYFAVADLQYTIRTEGDFNYRYQNDLNWSLNAGRYLYTDHEGTISLQAALSGEYKGMDVYLGEKATDTGVNSMFLGPEVDFTISESFFGVLGVDIPLFIDNTDIQAVPDYRLRAAISWLF